MPDSLTIGELWVMAEGAFQQVSYLQATIANMMRKTGAKPFSPDDFNPFAAAARKLKPKQNMTIAEMMKGISPQN